MDVKQNVQKVVEKGGDIELKRVVKANNQLNYQPQLPNQLLDSKNQNNDSESIEDIFQTEEYFDMLRKQREIDNKSDELVGRCVKNFIDNFFVNPDAPQKKLQNVRQKNKENNTIVQGNPEEYAVPSPKPSQLLKMHKDAELKKKSFIFPPFEQKGIYNHNIQKIKQRMIIKDQPDDYLLNIKDDNPNPSDTMHNKVNQTETDKKKIPSEKTKFDFFLINNKQQSMKKENIINKTIGNLPRDIQAISQLKDDQIEGQQQYVDHSPIIYQTQELQEKFVNYVNDDLIETFSVIQIMPKQNPKEQINSLFIYRDLAPISRFLVKKTGIPLKKGTKSQSNSATDLIMPEEIHFDLDRLTLSNILDIASGRVNDDHILTHDSREIELDELPESMQERVKEIIKESIQAQVKQNQLLKGQGESSTLFKKSDNQESSPLKKQGKLQVEAIEKKSQKPAAAPNPHSRNQLLPDTAEILSIINDLKLRKNELSNIESKKQYEGVKQAIKEELSLNLKQLFAIITEQDQDSPTKPLSTSREKDFQFQLNQVLSNLDSIKSKKTRDGYLKTQLLFTFLQEYKWLKMDELESNARQDQILQDTTNKMKVISVSPTPKKSPNRRLISTNQKTGPGTLTPPSQKLKSQSNSKAVFPTQKKMKENVFSQSTAKKQPISSPYLDKDRATGESTAKSRHKNCVHSYISQSPSPIRLTRQVSGLSTAKTMARTPSPISSNASTISKPQKVFTKNPNLSNNNLATPRGSRSKSSMEFRKTPETRQTTATSPFKGSKSHNVSRVGNSKNAFTQSNDHSRNMNHSFSSFGNEDSHYSSYFGK